MLSLVRTPPETGIVECDEETRSYYVLNEKLEPIPCDRPVWEAYQATDAATVAVTRLGPFATIVSVFRGEDWGFDDDPDEEGPYLFQTSVTFLGVDEDVEEHRTWLETEEAHRARVRETQLRLRIKPPEGEPELALADTEWNGGPGR